MDKPFVGVVELLKTVYGEEQVHTGRPVPAEVIAEVERELGVRWPDDYKRLVATWGYLCAGPSGNITVWGIAQGDTGLDYEVDVRRATELMREELAERMAEDDELREAIEEAGGAFPAVGWAEDFPHHTVHVFDRAGDLRWFLVKEHAYDEASGTSFTDYLQGRAQRALEDKLNDLVGASLGGGEADADGEDGPPDLSTMHGYAVPPAVAAALRQVPRCASDVRLYSTVDELGVEEGDGDIDPASADDNDQLRLARSRFVAALGGDAPAELRAEPIMLFARSGDALGHILAAAGHPAAVLFGPGADLLRDAPEERVALATPDQVRRAAGELDDLERVVREGFDLDALLAAGACEPDAERDELLDSLVAELEGIQAAATDAAERGWAWVSERAPF